MDSLSKEPKPNDSAVTIRAISHPTTAIDDIRNIHISYEDESHSELPTLVAHTNGALSDVNRFIKTGKATTMTKKMMIKGFADESAHDRGFRDGIISHTCKEMQYNEKMVNANEKISNTGILRRSNYKIVSTLEKSYDLRSLSVKYSIPNTLYSKTVAQQGYAQMLRDGSMGQKSNPMVNINYKFHDLPVSANLVLADEVSGLKVGDAITNVLKTNLSGRAHDAIRAFVKNLERFPQFDYATHKHMEKSLIQSTDEAFCDTCAVRFFSKEYLNSLGIQLEQVIDDGGLNFSSLMTVVICHGLLLYGLMLCRNTKTPTTWEKLAYTPHHVVSTLAKSFLAEGVHAKYEPSAGCEMLKSTSSIDMRHFQRRLFLACFLDFNKLITYAVRQVQINDGAMILHVPQIYTNTIQDSDDSSRYRVCQVSETQLMKYASYKPNASIFVPVLKLFINGADAMNQTGIYVEICKYMVAYLSALVKHKFISNTLDVIQNNHIASEFVLHGSLKVLGVNNGILLVKVVEKYDPQFCRMRHYDKYYNFCTGNDDLPPIVGESDVDLMSLIAIISPSLLNVLNEVVIRFLGSKNMEKDEMVSLTWCFEYGGTAIICHRGKFTIKSGDEGKQISENVIDITLPDDDFNWAEEVDRTLKASCQEILQVEESSKDNRTKVFDLLREEIRRDHQYSVNVLNHNIAVNVVNARISRLRGLPDRGNNIDRRNGWSRDETRDRYGSTSRDTTPLSEFPMLSSLDKKEVKEERKTNKKEAAKKRKNKKNAG